MHSRRQAAAYPLRQGSSRFVPRPGSYTRLSPVVSLPGSAISAPLESVLRQKRDGRAPILRSPDTATPTAGADTGRDVTPLYQPHSGRHFKMVCYYGFLANRKRGTLLPRVYKVLEMEVRTKPVKPGFAVLMKGFLGTVPYQCLLCGNRLRFAGTQRGLRAAELLSERLHRMERKRWLQTSS
ncbi:hypothetical protein SAMN05421579_12015 [Xenorhabdus japonica]|uniref:Transposase n=1 Tax=Xenorhabdus japonica TaxID=53341 RepID=A0A1I5BLK5_9GAMM|nr:hypothetical protein SAMN05421579_12015 [Xenorhabdus japonica]